MRTVLLFLHLIGITFWVGGLFINTLVLMPSMQVLSPPDRGKLMGAYLKRFAPMSWGAIALVVISGVILTSRFGFPAGVSTGYGGILLAKIVLTVVMILNGTYLGLVLGPKIAASSPPAGAPKPAGPGEGDRPAGPPPELLRLQRRMNILMWVSVGLGVVVLFLMGLI